jgi:hypothetical protein
MCNFITPYCVDVRLCDLTKLLEWMQVYNSNEEQVARLASSINSMCERR